MNLWLNLENSYLWTLLAGCGLFFAMILFLDNKCSFSSCYHTLYFFYILNLWHLAWMEWFQNFQFFFLEFPIISVEYSLLANLRISVMFTVNFNEWMIIIIHIFLGLEAHTHTGIEFTMFFSLVSLLNRISWTQFGTL